MLDGSGLAKGFWGDCLASLVHVWNRCPAEAVKDTTPYELWHGCKPDVSHLRVWGCTAYVHVQEDKRRPLESHMEKCVFLGYPEGYKGWKFYNPTSKRTLISERADFDERYFPMSKRSPLPSQPPPAAPAVVPPSPSVEYYNPGATLDSESECNEVLDHGGEPLPLPANSEPPAIPDEVIAPPVRTPSPDPHPRPPSPVRIGARLPMHTRQKPREWWKLSPVQLDDPDQMEEESDDELAISASLPDEPLTFAEALTRPDAEKWRQAALEELAVHQTNGTWTLVPKPAGSKVIGSKWVFKVKRNADGSIDGYKARLVAKGYNQHPGFDYLEVFAPTVCLSSI